jgi:hypothetical protein
MPNNQCCLAAAVGEPPAAPGAAPTATDAAAAALVQPLLLLSPAVLLYGNIANTLHTLAEIVRSSRSKRNLDGCDVLPNLRSVRTKSSIVIISVEKPTSRFQMY